MSARGRVAVADRLWAKIVVAGPDDCWPWTGSTTGGTHRYGRIGVGSRGVDRRLVLAHRLVYELMVGPIPIGQEVRHSCDNPPCCNPRHLLTGTHHENMMDMAARRRVRHTRLTDDEVRTIRLRAAAREGHTAIARSLGVSTGSVAAVLEGRTFAYVPDLAEAVIRGDDDH